ncbi:MAG: Holliday junction branch migration protein RuvA [Myxococcota bacterium]
MIARLRGTVADVAPDHVVLDVNGVGYEVFVPARTAETARVDATLTLHVHTAMREDAITLYGFAAPAEKETFLLLTTVQQVGPKLALSALSAMTVEALSRAINGNDLKALTAISGVGKKTAERMVLELKGKLAWTPASGAVATAPKAAPDDPLPLALAQLGYKKSEIDVAIARLTERGLGDAPLDKRLAESLRIFSAGARA